MLYTFIVTTVYGKMSHVNTEKIGAFYLCKLCFKSLWLEAKPENVMALNVLANKTFKEPFCISNSLRNFKNLLFGNVLKDSCIYCAGEAKVIIKTAEKTGTQLLARVQNKARFCSLI